MSELDGLLLLAGCEGEEANTSNPKPKSSSCVGRERLSHVSVAPLGSHWALRTAKPLDTGLVFSLPAALFLWACPNEPCPRPAHARLPMRAHAFHAPCPLSTAVASQVPTESCLCQA